MSCIVYKVNKKTGIKYAYEIVSYWDKDKQQPRSKRKYLGRVDPETGKIIRDGKSKNNSVEPSEKGSLELSLLYDELQKKDKIISDLACELEAANKKYDELAESVRKMRLFAAKEFSDV